MAIKYIKLPNSLDFQDILDIKDVNNLTGNTATFKGDVEIQGELRASQITQIVKEEVVLKDNLIDINSDATTDADAEGAGISIGGLTSKTIVFSLNSGSLSSFNFSEHLNLASGKEVYYNGTVLREVTEELKNKTIDADLNTISNIEDENIKSGANINVEKLGTGIIDNDEFNTLDGIDTSLTIQEQFDKIGGDRYSHDFIAGDFVNNVLTVGSSTHNLSSTDYYGRELSILTIKDADGLEVNSMFLNAKINPSTLAFSMEAQITFAGKVILGYK